MMIVMPTLPIRISSPKTEGSLQVSKWLKVQVLLDVDEMQQLIQSLGTLFFVVVSEPVKADEAVIFPNVFLEKYASYVDRLKQGQIPNADEFRRFFSCAMSSSLDTFYAIAVANDQFLIKPKQPIVQLQMHHFFYSDLDGKFHPMVLSTDSISWGLQFSYPQLFQDPITRQVVKVIDSPDFPNTAMFTKLLKWMRHFTLPTPFEVIPSSVENSIFDKASAPGLQQTEPMSKQPMCKHMGDADSCKDGDAGAVKSEVFNRTRYKGKRINSPIRIGKQSLAWIKNHPQLQQRGIQIVRIFGSGA